MVRVALIIGLVGLLGLLLVVWKLGYALAPVLVAILLAYLCVPLMERLSQWGVSKRAGAILVSMLLFLLIMAVFVFAVPVLISDFVIFLGQFPARLTKAISVIGHWFPDLSDKLQGMQALQEIREFKLDSIDPNIVVWITSHVGIAAGKLWAVVIRLVYFLLVPLVFFFILLRGYDCYNKFILLFPVPLQQSMSDHGRKIHQVLCNYFRGQGIVMVILAVMYTLALNLLGLPFATLVGILTGLLNFIPIVGWTTGLIAAIFMWLSTGTLSYASLMILVLIYLVLNLFEGLILTPRLVGKYCGLSAMTVLVLIFVGGSFFGFWGVILAIPFVLVARECVRIFLSWYKESLYYRGE